MQTGSAPQNKIAVIWDFDRTLIAGHMQRPLFAYFGVDEQQFWREANSYSEFFKKRGHELISTDCAYLLHILAYVRAGRFPGLSNQLLAKLGQELVPHTGLPEFFDMLRDQVRADPAYRKYDIDVEHYIVSSGLRQMILGSVFGPMATDVWACEFVEELPYPGYLDGAVPPDDWRDESTSRIQAIGYQLDNTT